MGSNLQNKLLGYEENPPERVWAALSTILDEAASPALTQKLQQFEATPPPASWQRIDAQLDQPEKAQAPVVPFFKRFRRPLRYTGAAAIMAFLAIVASLTISKKTISEEPASGTKAPMHGHTIPNSTINAKGDVVSAPVAIPVHGQAATGTSSNKNTLFTSLVRATHLEPGFASFVAPRATRTSAITADRRMDAYMIYTDDEGHAVRLPKKMFDLIACPTEGIGCRERLKRMQEKIAAAALSPGFGGVLDLLNQLKENQ
jgi:hypothetical protein